MEILIPTINRALPLATVLASLAAQDHPFDVIIADQSRDSISLNPTITALLRILNHRGHKTRVLINGIHQGVAQQRELLLQFSRDPHLLFLDDDVWLAPGALAQLESALIELECGFVGMPLIGLSHINDVRPWEQDQLEFWNGKPEPEVITPDSSKWQRHQLHNAATPAHISDGVEKWQAYKIAWLGGCVLYQREALEEIGGWSFWSQLPVEHAGEDVAVQLKIMAKRGAAGILPSLAYHLEVPTTIPERKVQAYEDRYL